ncbi:MAG: hypothetical protein HYY13_00055 [Nitrospirae bacterium]|nr:hypothetical protein [Nitrospirota bacterium]
MRRPSLRAVLLFALVCGCDGEETELKPEDLPGWTRNPGLEKDVGLWEARTFCWTIGGDCPDDVKFSKAEWVEDGNIYLRAEDDNTGDLGTDVAALTQGLDFNGNNRGTALDPIRTSEVEGAYILFNRSDAGATGCSGIVGSGNIINFWLQNPDTGARWVTDFYFETVGLNAGFGERAAPHNEIVNERITLGIDWYAYQIEIPKFPEYWTRTDDADGVQHWVIDLKALLDRGAEFSGRDLNAYRWQYVEVVSENVCTGGKVGESASWQRIHRFEIKVKRR